MFIRRCVVSWGAAMCRDALRSAAKWSGAQRSKLRSIAWLMLLLTIYQPAYAAGTLPVALAQQVDANGQPLSGALFYTFQAGTVSAPQNTYQDFGLTLPNPWPLQADTTGRIPNFYMQDGQTHARLTTAQGVVVFDIPQMQVVGPSSGGGTGGGTSVDPTTVATTGDIKWRATNEVLTGWVKANGQTIGNPTSGASQRANADTQNLYSYLWTNCIDAHCPVIGGRGPSAIADFNGGKQITLPDLRSRIPFGLDDMGAVAAGRLQPGNMVGPGDTPTTPGGIAGEINHTITQAQVPNYAISLTTTVTDTRTWGAQGSGAGGSTFAGLSGATGVNVPVTVTGGSITAATTGSSGGSGVPMSVVNNSILGTWFMKL